MPPVVTCLLRHYEEPALAHPPGLIRQGVTTVEHLARALGMFFITALFALAMTDEAAGRLQRAARRSSPLPYFPTTPAAPAYPVGNPGRAVGTPSPVQKGR